MSYSKGYGADAAVNKLVGAVIFIALFVALAPTVLLYIANISTSGIVLAAVVSTIAGILLGVFALKAILSYFK